MITNAALDKSLPFLLRPVIRLCVRYGIKIHQVEAAIKGLFVQEARKFLADSNQQPSTSKVSVMTGLQRPAVEALSGNSQPPPGESLAFRVIGAWTTRKKFITTRGAPRVLSFEGKSSEFAELVGSVSQAINPYTVLFELERARLVRRAPRGLELVSQSFMSRHDVDLSLRYLANDINDLAFSVEHNIGAEDVPLHHHLTTEFDNIPADKAPRIQKLLLMEGDRFHKKIKRLLGRYDRDTSTVKGSAASIRMAVCSFSSCAPKE